MDSRELKKLDAAARRAIPTSKLRAQPPGAQAVADCVDFIVAEKNPRAAFAGAVPFLKLMGIVAGGWQMARAALAAERLLFQQGDKSFLQAKIATARFYGDHVLVQAPGLRDTVVKGAVRRDGALRGPVPRGLERSRHGARQGGVVRIAGLSVEAELRHAGSSIGRLIARIVAVERAARRARVRSAASARSSRRLADATARASCRPPRCANSADSPSASRT